MSEKKAPGKLADAKGTQKSAKSTTKQAAKKAAARPSPRADKTDGESAVLATFAAMPEPDRGLSRGDVLQLQAWSLPPRMDCLRTVPVCAHSGQ